MIAAISACTCTPFGETPKSMMFPAQESTTALRRGSADVATMESISSNTAMACALLSRLISP
jgi:hypothetical protein